MTVQAGLFYAGVACFVISAALLVITVRTYVVRDIRGVRDDLRGRRRRRDDVPSVRRDGHRSADALRAELPSAVNANEKDASCVGFEDTSDAHPTVVERANGNTGEVRFEVTRRLMLLGTDEYMTWEKECA